MTHSRPLNWLDVVLVVGIVASVAIAAGAVWLADNCARWEPDGRCAEWAVAEPRP